MIRGERKRRVRRVAYVLSFGAFALALQGCGGGGGDASTNNSAGVVATVQATKFSVQTVSPQTGIPGTSITVEGQGFTRNTRVLWGDVEVAALFQSPKQLTFQLPATHSAQDISHPLTLKREDSLAQTWSQPVTVEAVPEPTGLSSGSAREGQIVRVVGANLQLISKLALGQTTAVPSSIAADGSWLEFIVPAQAPSGSVVGYDSRGYSFPIGTLQVTGPALAVTIQDVEVSQGQLISVSQATPNPYLRLVPQRPTLVRVRLAPNGTAFPVVPEVRVTVRNNALGSQTFVMQGPATLGMTPVAESDLANSYTYTVPGEWIGPGFQLEVSANQIEFPLSIARFSYVPPAGVIKGGTYIRMHVVPIAPDTGEQLNFDRQWFTNNLKGVYPLSDVEVIIEPPLPGSGTNTSGDWLSAVRSLRAASSAKNYDFYFGAMPYDGATGLGYVPGRVAVASHLWYGRQDYSIQGVMMHEIGHNFGRIHSWDDPKFPYTSNYWVGGPWASVMDQQGNRQYQSPTVWHDVMSYSYPKTISDFTYSGAYDYLAQNLPLSAKPAPAEAVEVLQTRGVDASATADALYLSGSIDLSTAQAKVEAPVRLKAEPDTVSMAATLLQAENDYVLELTTASARLRYPLQLQGMGDAEGKRSGFELTIPAVDGIQSIRLLRGLNALQTITAIEAPKPKVLRQMPVPADAVVRSWGTYRLSGANVELTWDAARWPWLSVWQNTSAGLLPLAVARTGGAISVPLRKPFAQTKGLIISVSDGMNTRLESFSF